MCPIEVCTGLVHVAWEKSPPQPSKHICLKCGTGVCARRACGVPWTNGHQCADIIAADAERQAAAERAAAEAAEAAAERRAAQRQAATVQWNSGNNSMDHTMRRLKAAPCIRPCPTCGVMVEHGGGCNMMYHNTCSTRWCFVCLRIGTCSDYHCKASAEGQEGETLRSADAVVQDESQSQVEVSLRSVPIAEAVHAVYVDHSKPVVKIRVCFNDGSKEVCLNEEHTIGDLRHMCSGTDHANIELKARFPGALPLTDDGLSLKAAGLLNAVVIARPLKP